jgi:hypothetical protein
MSPYLPEEPVASAVGAVKQVLFGVAGGVASQQFEPALGLERAVARAETMTMRTAAAPRPVAAHDDGDRAAPRARLS